MLYLSHIIFEISDTVLFNISSTEALPPRRSYQLKF